MAADLLKNTDTRLEDIDLIAVAHGPGSFTGIRIGVSCVKGLSWGAEKPVCGISTLEAMAWNGIAAAEGDLICPVMDARRSQVYNALFRLTDGCPKRLTADRAISLETLKNELCGYKEPVFLTGDGAVMTFEFLKAAGLPATLAPSPVRLQTAWGVAMAAKDKIPVSVNDLIPVYLRLSQAERERQAANQSGKIKKEI